MQFYRYIFSSKLLTHQRKTPTQRRQSIPTRNKDEYADTPLRAKRSIAPAWLQATRVQNAPFLLLHGLALIRVDREHHRQLGSNATRRCGATTT